jgi:hypothetical protein
MLVHTERTEDTEFFLHVIDLTTFKKLSNLNDISLTI